MGKKRHGEAYATGNTHGDCAVSMLFGSHDRLLMLRIVGAAAQGGESVSVRARSRGSQRTVVLDHSSKQRIVV